jgi:hypothetical protein
MLKQRQDAGMVSSLKFAAMAVLALFATPASAQIVRGGERITISYRWMGVCCSGGPDFQVSVSPSGDVRSTQRLFRQVIRFRATPQQLASFRHELQAVRPTLSLTTHEICPVVWLTEPGSDPRENWMKVDEVSVAWSDATGTTELHACYADRRLKAAVDRALVALFLNPHGGNRISSRSATFLLCEIRALEREPHPTLSECYSH